MPCPSALDALSTIFSYWGILGKHFIDAVLLQNPQEYGCQMSLKALTDRRLQFSPHNEFPWAWRPYRAIS